MRRTLLCERRTRQREQRLPPHHMIGLAVVAITAAMWAGADAARAEAELVMMNPDGPLQCFQDEKGVPWRVQCDSERKRCLYAPDGILDDRGEVAAKLERARSCPYSSDPVDFGILKSSGYELVRALPDAPYGWTRDRRGRVFQINFDLKRRMYLGAGYAPQRISDGGSDDQRSAIDIGLLVLEKTDKLTRHRLRLVEGEMALAPFSADVVFFHYDVSHRYRDPPLKITTFFGKPRRHDVGLDLGFWLEGGHLEIHTAPGLNERMWRIATLHGTVDLWQSRQMYSFVRLRGGVGVESATMSGEEEDRVAVTPGGALEADLTLDKNGFHHFGVEVGYHRPYYTTTHSVLGDNAERMSASLEYEVIILAINDQPLSLRLAVDAERRDDSLLLPDGWITKAHAGLRFSLWAPPRIK